MKKIWAHKASSFKEAEEFDIKFWARAGVRAKFSAAWTMLKDYYMMGNKHGYKSRLQRSIEVIKQT